MGAGASIPLPDFLNRQETMVLAGRGRFSELKWVKVARENLPLGEEPTESTLISRRQFQVGFLDEMSTDEESEEDEEPEVMAGVGLPRDDQTTLSKSIVRGLLEEGDWSQRVADQFDALADDYGCISSAHYVQRILSLVRKQRIANRERRKAERQRQLELENNMASKLQAVARGFLNRKRDRVMQAEGFDFERIWFRLSKEERVILSLLRVRYDTDPIRFLAQLRRIMQIWSDALAEHDAEDLRRRAREGPSAAEKEASAKAKAAADAAALQPVRRSQLAKFKPKSAQEREQEREAARAAKRREQQRLDAAKEYRRAREKVELLREDREKYNIPHYDDSAAEVRAASKLAAIRRGMAARKMYPRLVHTARIWVERMPIAQFRKMFVKELEGVALVLDAEVFQALEAQGLVKVVRGSVWHMDILESVAGTVFSNRDVDPLKLLDQCFEELDFPVHITTAMRAEDRTVFLRLSARFRQAPRRVYAQMQQLWKQLHPLAFAVRHSWCSDDDAIVAQHFHDLQRDSLGRAPFQSSYSALQNWLCGAIGVAARQAVTADGAPGTARMEAKPVGLTPGAAAAPAAASGQSNNWWPMPIERMEPWVRKILSRWATFRDLRDPREETFRAIQRASEAVIRSEGHKIERRTFAGLGRPSLADQLGNIGLSAGATGVAGAARIDPLRYGDGHPAQLPTINLNWPSARQWQRRKFFRHSTSYVFMQILLARAMEPLFSLFCRLLCTTAETTAISAPTPNPADGMRVRETFRTRIKVYEAMHRCMERDAAAHAASVRVHKARQKRNEELEAEARVDLELAELAIRRDMTAQALQDQLERAAAARTAAAAAAAGLGGDEAKKSPSGSSNDQRINESKNSSTTEDRIIDGPSLDGSSTTSTTSPSIRLESVDPSLSVLATLQEATPFSDMYGSSIPAVQVEVFDRERFEAKIEESERAEFAARRDEYTHARPSPTAAHRESLQRLRALLIEHNNAAQTSANEKASNRHDPGASKKVCDVDAVLEFLETCPESEDHKRQLKLTRRYRQLHLQQQAAAKDSEGDNFGEGGGDGTGIDAAAAAGVGDAATKAGEISRARVKRSYHARLLLDNFPEAPGLPLQTQSRDRLFAALLDAVYGSPPDVSSSSSSSGRDRRDNDANNRTITLAHDAEGSDYFDDRDLERGGPGAGVRRLEREPASFTDTVRCTVTAETPEVLADFTERLLAWNTSNKNERGMLAAETGTGRGAASSRVSKGEPVIREGAADASSSSVVVVGQSTTGQYRDDVDDAYASSSVPDRSSPGTKPQPDDSKTSRMELLLAAGAPQVLAIRNGFSKWYPALTKVQCGYRDIRLALLFNPTPLLVKALVPLARAEAARRAARPGSLEAASAAREVSRQEAAFWHALQNPPTAAPEVDASLAAEEERRRRLRRSLSQSMSSQGSSPTSASSRGGRRPLISREEELERAKKKIEEQRRRAATVTWGDVFDLRQPDVKVPDVMTSSDVTINASGLDTKKNDRLVKEEAEDEGKRADARLESGDGVRSDPHVLDPGSWARWEESFFEGMPAAKALDLRSQLQQARDFLLSREFRSKPAALVGELQLQLPEYRSLQQQQRLHLEVVAPSEPSELQRHFALHPVADEEVVLL